MRRRLGLLVVAFAVLVGAGGAFAQTGPDLTPLYGEFETLFAELGNDTVSHLLPFGLIMDGTGRAEVGKSFFFSLSAGTTFLPGIATFRDDDPSPFTYLGGLFDMLDTVIPAGIAETIYTGSETFFLDPGFRASAGLALANGLEIWGHVGVFPQVVANLVSNAVGIPGLVLNRMNAGGRVRMVLVKDQKWLPAVSIGAGYTFTQFNMGLSDLGALGLDGLEFSGFELSLDGDLYAQTRLHTAGVELAVSKKLLFIAPFVRLGAWYQWASYHANIDGLAIELSDGTNTISVTGTLNETILTIHDLAFVATGGLELVMGKASLILQGSYDTASQTPAASASLQFRI